MLLVFLFGDIVAFLIREVWVFIGPYYKYRTAMASRNELQFVIWWLLSFCRICCL